MDVANELRERRSGVSVDAALRGPSIGIGCGSEKTEKVRGFEAAMTSRDGRYQAIYDDSSWHPLTGLDRA
jgi:hypothetical protein